MKSIALLAVVASATALAQAPSDSSSSGTAAGASGATPTTVERSQDATSVQPPPATTMPASGPAATERPTFGEIPYDRSSSSRVMGAAPARTTSIPAPLSPGESLNGGPN